MGRSRGVFQSADEELGQRSRRKKNASAGENLESATAGQGSSEGKRTLYHCNYCNKDMTGRVRIKCALCSDFDLCVECFSVGAEVTPHRNNHPYRVMDNLSFPLFCPDWNADDEMLLLEGIEMYGLGNWAEVAEHVGTKSKEQCIEHYDVYYLKSPCFPLPDMSHVVGKNRKELLAMAKGHGEEKKGFSLLGEHNVKEESPFSPLRVKVEDSPKGGSSGHQNAEVDGVHSAAAGNKPSNAVPSKDANLEDPQKDRSIGGKKPHSSPDEGPPLAEMSGYNPKRQEFDIEYDNEAEQMLADMEFKETDTEEERDLKLRVLRIYSKRLDERKRRKDFILERNLLYPSAFEKSLSPAERELCQQYNRFMRFHSKEDHEQLLQSVVQEYRIKKKLSDLKEAQAAGFTTKAKAERYLESKRRKEAEESDRRAKEGASADPNSRTAAPPSSNSLNNFDVLGLPGADLLSESEKRLCVEIKLAPQYYLKMQEILSIEIFKGSISSRSDAHHLFKKVEPGKVDKVLDVLGRKGISLP
ncbi:SANT/Myb domain [Dillenia turbinata]|uniref:Transcriptional adapter n=1 Tax=Dillenia turbinata TaxID=194707 RepID=A0AAN8UJC4_9MAGN